MLIKGNPIPSLHYATALDLAAVTEHHLRKRRAAPQLSLSTELMQRYGKVYL